MASVGQILKERRKELDLTIEDLQIATKISTKYLHALESDEFQKIPGDAYTRGFIGVYANAVGLDGALLIAQYKREFIQPESRPDTSSGGEVENVLNRDLTAKPRSLWIFLAIIAALALLAFAYFGWLRSTPEASPPKPKPVSSPKEQTPSTEKQPVPDSQPAPQLSEIKLSLTIVTADCWMEIIVDGQQVFVGTMKNGETKKLKGTKSIYVYAVSGKRVEATLNGKSIGFLKDTDDSVSRTFTLQGIEEGQLSVP